MAGFKDIATILAFLIGGYWTYHLYNQFRDTAPRLTTTHHIQSWPLPDGRTLVRIEAAVVNSGKVKVEPLNGDMLVQELLPMNNDQLARFQKSKLIVDCIDDTGKPIPNCVENQGIRPGQTFNFNLSGADRSLEPGESTYYRRYAIVRGEVRALEVYTDIKNPDEGGRRGWIVDTVQELNNPLESPIPVQTAAATTRLRAPVHHAKKSGPSCPCPDKATPAAAQPSPALPIVISPPSSSNPQR